MPYRVLDHTADLALEVRGEELSDLFVEALRALTDCLTDVDGLAPRERRSVELEGGDLEQLLVEWLGEAVYLFDAEDLVLCAARVELDRGDGPWRLRAVVEGERLDPSRHPVKVPIKGVTYHRLEVRRRRDGGWRARVVLDI